MFEVPQLNEGWNFQKLNAFTESIVDLYENSKIKAPIHCCGGEDQAEALIEIFKFYKKGDWIFSTWRSSWHWLLSGRDPEKLKDQIVSGYSMHVYDDKFFTSAIVGGIAPIAIGVAWALKQKESENRVLCFLGDGAYECGIVYESIKYAERNDLPIVFIIEDNGLSVNANTQEIWGLEKKDKTLVYKYIRKFPHAGTGKYIMF